jgi:hypothetical protein
MGRDQVKRNQVARGRGRGGAGGRGGGGGGGGGAGGKTNRRGAGKSSSSSSALSLGDNSHRYDHRSSRSRIDVGVDDDEDDDGRMEAFDTAFAHCDYASPSSLTRHDDDSLDFFADSAPTTTCNNTDRNVDNDDETRARNSWMEIDIKALDKYLRQNVPLHVRLQVPIHIASHVDERYGVTSNRKKTLAELREESKCIVVQHDDDDDGCASSSIIETISECSNHDEFTNVVQVDGGINEKYEADKDDDDDDDDDDNDDADDEDLEAWLDDVIS